MTQVVMVSRRGIRITRFILGDKREDCASGAATPELPAAVISSFFKRQAS